jgi:hypothetical protein
MPPHHLLFGSVTRISDLQSEPFEVEPLPRTAWATGDYVLADVEPVRTPLRRVELPNGRMADIAAGDRVVGTLGVRKATLEVVGDWRGVSADGRMHVLTSGQVFGWATSRSLLLPPLMAVTYHGHAMRGGAKLTMRAFAAKPPARTYDRPTVLLVGSSMSAGKTSAAKVIVRELTQNGRSVVGAKLTGAARYRDILTMGDAGAQRIFDFVDVGLPSTICPEDEYRTALGQLLSLIAGDGPDVVVAEAGASPLEPYNGDVVLETLGDRVRCMILCASDPYSVLGFMKAFDRVPDLITGIATTTSAGIELIEKLCGVTALNLLDRDSLGRLHAILERCLSA